jgi:hypothetical protein
MFRAVMYGVTAEFEGSLRVRRLRFIQATRLGKVGDASSVLGSPGPVKRTS